MSEQYPGGFITKAPPTPAGNTAISSAYGMWNLSQQAYYQAQGLWPDANNPVDAQFNYVTMLLHADGTNGATNGGSSSSNTPPFNTDASTNAFPIAVYGGAQPNNLNPYNGSYNGVYFDGSGDWLSTASTSAVAFGTGDFTLEAWVYPLSNQSGYRGILSAYDGDGPVIETSGNYWAYFFAGSAVATSTLVVPNTWTHVALTRSGTTGRMFVNGVLAATASDSTNYSTNSTVTVGTLGGGLDAGYEFNGYISNARIVKGTAVYTSAFTPPTSPLTAISGTSFLGCQSNRFIDNSASPLTITVSGNPSISYNQPFTLPSTYSTYGSGYFDNDGDYLTSTGVALGTGNATFEFWIYPFDSTTTYNCVYDTRASGNASSGFGIFQYGLTIEVYDSALVVASAAGSLKVNAWNHVALVRNSGTCQLYINGVASGSSAANSTNLSSTERRIATGSTNTYYYYGYISDLRENSTAVYTTTFTPPTAPLSAISGTQLLTLQTNGAANDSGFIDSSPNDFPITRNGNTTQGSFSPYGSNWSNYFNGSSYLTVANNSAFILGSTWSIEAWVNPSTTQGTQTVAAKWYNATANGSYLLYISNATILGGVYPDYYNDSSLYPTPNQWNHIVMTCDGTRIRFFLNGQLGTVASGVTTNISADNGLPFSIGSNYNGTAPFTGYISNVRVTTNAIPTTYQTTSTTFGAQIFTPPTAPLTTSSQGASGVSLLACQSNRFIDNSSNAFALTVGGTPSVQRFNPFGTSTAYSTTTIGGSGYFDGTGDYLSVPSSTALTFGTGDFTVEGWFYPAQWNAANSSTITTGPSNNALQLSQYSSTQFGVAASNVAWIVYATFPALNQWTHVAVSRSGTSLKLFFNGAVVATATNSTNFTANTSIGANTSGGDQIYGNLSDVRMIKGAALYTSAFTPPTAPLTAVSGTQLLCNFKNAAIYDNAMMNDLETVGNAQISTSVKKYGTGSMYFDGTGDYVKVSSPNLSMGTGDFTIEYWFYALAYSDTSDTSAMFDSRSGNDTSGFMIGPVYNDINRLHVAQGTGPIISASTTYSLNTWTHCAVVRSSGTLTLYQNGVNVGSVANTTNNTATTNFIGSGYWLPSGTGQMFNGYIDDLRITKGYARYTTTFTPPTAALPNIGPT